MEEELALKQQDPINHNYKYANPFKRILSFFIDAFTAIIITAYPLQYLQVQKGWFFVILTLIIHALTTNLIRIVFVGYWQKTPGMFFFKMKVQPDNGNKINLKRAFIRELPLLAIIIVEILFFVFRFINSNVSDITYSSAIKTIYPNGKGNIFSYSSQIYYLVIFIVMFFNLKRKAIIDFFAKTIVVQE